MKTMKLVIALVIMATLCLLFAILAFHNNARLLEAQQLIGELYLTDAIVHVAVKRGNVEAATRYLEVSARDVAQYAVKRASIYRTDLATYLYRTQRTGFITGIEDNDNSMKLNQLYNRYNSKDDRYSSVFICYYDWMMTIIYRNYWDSRNKWGYWGRVEPVGHFMANGYIRLPVYSNAVDCTKMPIDGRVIGH